jgi:hypothetical protein
MSSHRCSPCHGEKLGRILADKTGDQNHSPSPQGKLISNVFNGRKVAAAIEFATLTGTPAAIGKLDDAAGLVERRLRNADQAGASGKADQRYRYMPQ